MAKIESRPQWVLRHDAAENVNIPGWLGVMLAQKLPLGHD